MTFALGEVQTPDTSKWSRHAVRTEESRPSSWARGICPAQPLVWVHEIAGEPVPFPGYVDALAAGEACPECTMLTADAKKTYLRGFRPER